MGEIIRIVSRVRLKDMSLNIELNDGTVKAKKPQYIHLQNERFRLALSDSEYIQMAIAIRTAASKMLKQKKIEG